MKVLLLAAGRSKRAKPIEDKNFLKFCGKFLIEHQLKALKKAGFEDVIIMGGAHNLDRLKSVANQAQTQAQVLEQKNLDDGMAGAILEAADTIGKEPLFIVSSNDVVDQKAYDLMMEASKNGSDAYLLAYKVDEYFPGGYLQTEGDRITGIVEKPEEGSEPSDLVNVVLHLHKSPQALFDTLKETNSSQDDRYELALDKLMKEQSFQAVPYSGYWQPVKFPWHVLDLMNHFLENCNPDDSPQIDPSAQIAETAIIRGKVTIGPGTKVFDNAVVQGPAYIGENCIVANNAMLRGSMTGDNCVIGFGTEMARSFIGDDCWFHSNYVGDTVMGNDVTFGGGAVCANLRLDEKEIADSKRNKLGPVLGDSIRIGVQTSLMPGVKIGSNTMITSGLVISQDIEPGKFVTGKFELEIKDNRAIIDKNARKEMKGKL
jgi:UDP-N-acetylglucosamine diphosphorylase / glucose-1-phosphate thymidylyltransferase / UDP-N-acetylgalactosamine diphosphorylase / glucosamine-1-phosphate N-acetyltransferase / galactosamine-1-phosphate N-acetyltransferase